MEKKVKIVFLTLGITIAVLGSIKQAQAKLLTGDCVGDGSCGLTDQGTKLVGKWHETDFQ